MLCGDIKPVKVLFFSERKIKNPPNYLFVKFLTEKLVDMIAFHCKGC